MLEAHSFTHDLFSTLYRQVLFAFCPSHITLN